MQNVEDFPESAEFTKIDGIFDFGRSLKSRDMRIWVSIQMDNFDIKLKIYLMQGNYLPLE